MFVLFRKKLVQCEITETLNSLGTAACLCTAAIVPNYAGQVPLHFGARASCFRIREEGTHGVVLLFEA